MHRHGLHSRRRRQIPNGPGARRARAPDRAENHEQAGRSENRTPVTVAAAHVCHAIHAGASTVSSHLVGEVSLRRGRIAPSFLRSRQHRRWPSVAPGARRYFRRRSSGRSTTWRPPRSAPLPSYRRSGGLLRRGRFIGLAPSLGGPAIHSAIERPPSTAAARLRKKSTFSTRAGSKVQYGTSHAAQKSHESRQAVSPRQHGGDVVNRRGTAKGLSMTPVIVAVVLLGSLLTRRCLAQTQVGNYASRAVAGRSVVVTGATGESIRITPYGDYIVRIQVAKNGRELLRRRPLRDGRQPRLARGADGRRDHLVADADHGGRRRRLDLARQATDALCLLAQESERAAAR